MVRGGSMILTFDVPPLASRWGLCDIDRVQLGVTQKFSKKMGIPPSEGFSIF